MADLYDLGERPPLGEVPKRMHAYVVRQNRFGPPRWTLIHGQSMGGARSSQRRPSAPTRR